MAAAFSGDHTSDGRRRVGLAVALSVLILMCSVTEGPRAASAPAARPSAHRAATPTERGMV